MIPTMNIVTYYIVHCKAKEITLSKILDTTPKYRARWLTAGPFTAAIRGLGKSISSETWAKIDIILVLRKEGNEYAIYK